MAHQDFRARVGEAAWHKLRQSLVLVCRDALRSNSKRDVAWETLSSTLSRIGAKVDCQEKSRDIEFDVALSLLADFADPDVCRSVIKDVKDLVHTAAEKDLRELTEWAAMMVEHECPDQSFEFRASLILLSMLAAALCDIYT